jgi:hypothetical protein
MPMPRSIIAICLAGIVPAVAPALAQENKQPEKVSFYFAAHEDDWQLFMNPSAFEDVVSGAAKTVFVHLTAGDAGLGVGFGGRKHPFYLARENGAEAAIRFMANANSAPAERVVAPMTFNSHSIYRVSYRNTVGYFLRVPDGHWSGDGYYDTGFESLKRLASGDNETLHAVDGSAIYHGWNDLVATLREIVAYERGNAALIQVNVAETDARINPQDHSDHLMTAKAALDAVKDSTCVRRVYYVDYASSQLPRAEAGYGKLCSCRDPCGRPGLGPQHVMAPLRRILRWAELLPCPGAGGPMRFPPCNVRSITAVALLSWTVVSRGITMG